MARDVAAFKLLFSRGQFTYGTDVPDVRDADIEEAIAEATAVFNSDLYPSVAEGDRPFLYLAAHFLACDLDAADTGGQSRFVQNSRSADGLSESVEIPEELKSGEMSFYGTTAYGRKWWILSKPYADGAVFSVPGATQP